MNETIAELRRLHKAATPGKWYWGPLFGIQAQGIGPIPHNTAEEAQAIANANLICAMRNALPTLLDRLENLEADRERLLAALHLLEPRGGWEGLEDGDGAEIGTKIQAALDAVRFAKQPESETELSKGETA